MILQLRYEVLSSSQFLENHSLVQKCIPCLQDHSGTMSVIKRHLDSASLTRKYGGAWRHRCMEGRQFLKTQHDVGGRLQQHSRWHIAGEAGFCDVPDESFAGEDYSCWCAYGTTSHSDALVPPGCTCISKSM